MRWSGSECCDWLTNSIRICSAHRNDHALELHQWTEPCHICQNNVQSLHGKQVNDNFFETPENTLEDGIRETNACLSSGEQ